MVADGIGAAAVPPLAAAPWRYPGRAAARPVLLGAPAETAVPGAPLRPRAGRRLGAAAVHLDGADVPLDDALAAYGVAPTADRHPVAAYGSNADPAVLHAKLTAAAVSPVVPLTLATLRSAARAASAHVSRAGCIPAAAARADGADLPVVVGWLDDAQLACVTATEPNYRPLVLDPDQHPVTLAGSGEQLPAVTAYDTRRGVLDLPGLPAASQVGLWRAVLVAVPGLRSVLGAAFAVADRPRAAELHAVLRRLAADAPLRERVGAVLSLRSRPSGLRGRAGPAPPYRHLPSRWTTVPG